MIAREIVNIRRAIWALLCTLLALTMLPQTAASARPASAQSCVMYGKSPLIAPEVRVVNIAVSFACDGAVRIRGQLQDTSCDDRQARANTFGMNSYNLAQWQRSDYANGCGATYNFDHTESAAGVTHITLEIYAENFWGHSTPVSVSYYP